MREKILQRPTLFHVMGIPGSGKSWFSRHLTKQLHCVHVDTERIRFELFENQSYSQDEEIVVENMADYFSQAITNNQSNLIMDGTSSTAKRRKEIARFAEKHNYEYVLVWVQANEELCKVRSASKPDNSVDNFKRRLNGDQFTDLSSKIEKPSEKEDPVVVSGSHSFRAQLKGVVTRLNTMGLISIPNSKKNSKASNKKTTSTEDSDKNDEASRRNTQRVSG